MLVNFNTTITTLYEQGLISVRTYNCLHSACLETIGSIMNRIDKPIDLMRLRRFGRKSLLEIEPILNKVSHINEAEMPDDKVCLLSLLGEILAVIISEAYNSFVDGESRVKSYLKKAYPHPYDLHNLITGELPKMTVVVEGFSREENIEIRYAYKQFIEEVLRKMEGAKITGDKTYAKYQSKAFELSQKLDYFSNEDIAKNFMSPLKKQYLEKIYHNLIEKRISVKSKNIIEKYLPHFEDLIKYADEPFESYLNINKRRFMVKTLQELHQFNQSIFVPEFKKTIMQTDDEIELEIIKLNFPFLTSLQQKFVFNFIRTNNHLPLFFLLLHYLRQSKIKSDYIYCLFNGILDGRRLTINEVAKITNLTGARIRQILSKGIDAQQSSLKNYARTFYKELIELPVVYETTEEYIKLKEMESLPNDFGVFVSLLQLIGHFKLLEVKGHFILLNGIYADLKLEACLGNVAKAINAKYSGDTFMSLNSFIRSFPLQVQSIMKECIKYVVTDVYQVQIMDGECLFLPQTFIDIKKELYDILVENGKPMHVDDIFAVLKKRYPNHEYTNSEQIKCYLSRHQHIKPIGKSSHYALDTWDGIYFGSIRGLLVDLLMSSDLPLHIDKLYNEVHKHYPNTNKKSLAATMTDEGSKRFIGFEGGYFGLKSKMYSEGYELAQIKRRHHFDERFTDLVNFIEANHRFPFDYSSQEESSLMRWLYNVNAGNITISKEQINKLNNVLHEYDETGYPRSAREYTFWLKCQEVKEYIRQNQAFPTCSNSETLYNWLRSAKRKYINYTDKRHQYMVDLLDVISSSTDLKVKH